MCLSKYQTEAVGLFFVPETLPVNINIRGKNLIESVNKISHRMQNCDTIFFTPLLCCYLPIALTVCYSLLLYTCLNRIHCSTSAAQNGLNLTHTLKTTSQHGLFGHTTQKNKKLANMSVIFIQLYPLPALVQAVVCTSVSGVDAVDLWGAEDKYFLLRDRAWVYKNICMIANRILKYKCAYFGQEKVQHNSPQRVSVRLVPESAELRPVDTGRLS